jgi:hypothetical protein
MAGICVEAGASSPGLHCVAGTREGRFRCAVDLTFIGVIEERTAVFLELRTVVYPAPDLAASKAWAAALGVQPYSG